METATYTLPQPVKGSCTRGHKWEYDSTKLNVGSPTIQFNGFLGLKEGKKWCVLCIEEKLAEIGVGEVPTT